MTLKLSPLLHKKEVDKNVIGIYHPVGGHNFLFISKKLLWTLEQDSSLLDNSKISHLVSSGILVPEDFSPERYYFQFVKREIDIHLMYLLISQSCNLSCKYCFEGPSRGKLNLMGKEVVSKAIDFFFKVSTPDRKIFFYGGEPLLNKEVFKFAIRKIKHFQDIGNQVSMNIITNGTLIDQEIAEDILNYGVEVAVSIDGLREIHDAARLNKSGWGSYDAALTGFNLLKKTGVHPSISCTIGKHNVNRLEEVARFFSTELKPRSVGFNLMIGANESDCGARKATESLLKAYEILKEGGIYEDRIMRRLEKVINGEFYLKDCAAYGNQIAVRFDGRVGPCHAFCSSGEYFDGSIADESFELNKSDFGLWAGRSQLTNPKCMNCPLALLCGGGCAYNAKKMTGSVGGIDKHICIHTAMLVDWLIGEAWKRRNF